MGGAAGGHLVLAAAADGDPHGRPAGLGQDDRDREARQAPARSSTARRVAVAACDVYRPAAVDQLVKVGGQAGAEVYEQGTDKDPVDIARWALDKAKMDGKDVLIVDTSGRLHVDEALMDELKRIRGAVKPHAILLVVDAMTGQDAVNVAEQFAEAVDFDGVVMSKLDGDARGGAALSVKQVTGKPILYASTGEKLGDFERSTPTAWPSGSSAWATSCRSSRRPSRRSTRTDAAELERKLRKGQFTFEDFLDQMKMMRRMGPLSSLLGMIPGMGAQMRNVKIDDRELDRIEAIVLSMTPEERRRPELIKGSRRARIAKGSGTSVQQVNGARQAVRPDAEGHEAARARAGCPTSAP